MMRTRRIDVLRTYPAPPKKNGYVRTQSTVKDVNDSTETLPPLSTSVSRSSSTTSCESEPPMMGSLRDGRNFQGQEGVISPVKVVTSPPSPEELGTIIIPALGGEPVGIDRPRAKDMGIASGSFRGALGSASTSTEPSTTAGRRLVESEAEAAGVSPSSEEGVATVSTPTEVQREDEEERPVDLATACVKIRADLIGRLSDVKTPYGMKPLVYADWTASGRPIRSIESFMSEVVLPWYGNTHTTSSATGAQTTEFREEARHTIAKAVNAKEDDVVLFTGSGTTAAINKVVGALGLNAPHLSWLRPANRPVVFVGPFDHHSNILPWRESRADVAVIKEDSKGGLDLVDLENKLKKYSGRKLKIGSFAAASNVTGCLEKIGIVTRMLHRFGALSFWDFATSAPYVDIDMNPTGSSKTDARLSAIDAAFISGHKFLGGSGTPGVLVCKKRLFAKNRVPVVPGGGTVLFVAHDYHTYLDNLEEREEGGTPDILGSIRLGLVYQMKQKLGCVEAREEHLAQLGLRTLRTNPRVCILGDNGRQRLPILSFCIRHGQRYLHHNFVCALLNDLFGIQARAGCQCAGPYGIDLLGLPESSRQPLGQQLIDGLLIIKPGFTRLSLTYFMSDAEVKYLLDAVMFVADHGAMFLPQYEPCISTADWKHNSNLQAPSTTTPGSHSESHGKKRLNHLDYGFGNKVRHDPDGCKPCAAPGNSDNPTITTSFTTKPAPKSKMNSNGGRKSVSFDVTDQLASQETALFERQMKEALRHAAEASKACRLAEVERQPAAGIPALSLPGSVDRSLRSRKNKLSVQATTKWVLPKISENLRWFHWPEEPLSFGPTYSDPASSRRCIVEVKTYKSNPHAKVLRRGWTLDDKVDRSQSMTCEASSARNKGRKGWMKRQLSAVPISAWAGDVNVAAAEHRGIPASG